MLCEPPAVLRPEVPQLDRVVVTSMAMLKAISVVCSDVFIFLSIWVELVWTTGVVDPHRIACAGLAYGV